MKYIVLLMCFLGVFTPRLAAHCLPFSVQATTALAFTNGLSDPIGFAGSIYLEGSEDCGLDAAPVDRMITDIPGFDISGMAANSGLFLEPIPRTATTLSTDATRFAWYWDPISESVAPLPEGRPLRLRSQVGFGTIELPAGASPAPAPIQLASPLSTDLNQHKHFLRYEFQNVVEPFPGAVGFFARLTSPNYSPTAPFLVMLNSGLAPATLEQAARDINAIAGSGDFNGDEDWNCADIDLLIFQVLAGTNPPAFDLNGDGGVNTLDVDVWLRKAGAAELASGRPYLRGDANLDGVVDGTDFNLWNSHKFTAVPSWCAGDFNTDGVVDGSDFNVWNARKFTASDGSSTIVPEGLVIAFRPWLLAVVAFVIRGLRRRTAS